MLAKNAVRTKDRSNWPFREPRDWASGPGVTLVSIPREKGPALPPDYAILLASIFAMGVLGVEANTTNRSKMRIATPLSVEQELSLAVGVVR